MLSHSAPVYIEAHMILSSTYMDTHMKESTFLTIRFQIAASLILAGSHSEIYNETHNLGSITIFGAYVLLFSQVASKQTSE